MQPFRFRSLLLLLALLSAAAASARTFTVMAYNVENLFDADGKAVFDEYRGDKYTPAHVLTKLQHITQVVQRLARGQGPDVIFFCEIEVDQTPGATPPDYDAILRKYAGVKLEEMLGPKFDAEVADLPAEALLVKAFVDHGLAGYRVIASQNTQSTDGKRQLAQKCVVFTRLPVTAVHEWPTLDARAILEVDAEVDGAPLYLFGNHWKSGAGDPVTEKTRVVNAATLRRRLDEILAKDPNADIVIGGDFNSQYNQKARYGKTMPETGMNDVLHSQGNALAVRGPQRDLYNLWYDLPTAERGSDTYNGEWGTLMQLIISRGLFDFRGVQYVDHSFRVAKFAGLNMDDDGLPIHWNGAGPTGSGFSDHFPVYAVFKTVTDNRADRYLPVAKSNGAAESDEPVKIGHSKIDVEKVALPAAQVATGAALRVPANLGKIVRVEGKVAEGKRMAVEFFGESYDVWVPDGALRARLRERFRAGETVKFYGELGIYKEHWQFVIRDEAWVK